MFEDDENSEEKSQKDTVPQLNLAPPHHLHANSTLEETLTADVSISNSVLDALFVAWGSVRTISNVCKLAQTTMNVVSQRRELILKPSSYTDIIRQQQTKHLLNQSSSAITFEPLE